MSKTLRISDDAIRQMFSQYVESYEDMERHSDEAVRCAEVFDDFCSRHIAGDMLTKIEAYTKMTDVAVEFEEGGFVAGFKIAMNLFLSKDNVTQIKFDAEEVREQILNITRTNSTIDVEKAGMRRKMLLNDGARIDNCFITSVQIAELFGQVHSKSDASHRG